MDHHRHAINVVLRSPDGHYLTGGEDAWAWTDDPTKARVFDYLGDQIPERLALFQEQCGLPLAVIAADPRERYEVCDTCGHRIISFKAFFDGRHYLCPECRQH